MGKTRISPWQKWGLLEWELILCLSWDTCWGFDFWRRYRTSWGWKAIYNSGDPLANPQKSWLGSHFASSLCAYKLLISKQQDTYLDLPRTPTQWAKLQNWKGNQSIETIKDGDFSMGWEFSHQHGCFHNKYGDRIQVLWLVARNCDLVITSFFVWFASYVPGSKLGYLNCQFWRMVLNTYNNHRIYIPITFDFPWNGIDYHNPLIPRNLTMAHIYIYIHQYTVLFSRQHQELSNSSSSKWEWFWKIQILSTSGWVHIVHMQEYGWVPYMWSTPIPMDPHHCHCLIRSVLETINLYHGKSSEDFPKESIDMSYSQGQLIFLSSLTNPLIVPWLSMMESFPVDFLIIVPFWWGLVCIYITIYI